MNFTVDEAENLLKTEYHAFGHKETTKHSLACDEYRIPANLKRHIDFITPIELLPMLRKARPRSNVKTSESNLGNHFITSHRTDLSPLDSVAQDSSKEPLATSHSVTHLLS